MRGRSDPDSRDGIYSTPCGAPNISAEGGGVRRNKINNRRHPGVGQRTIGPVTVVTVDLDNELDRHREYIFNVAAPQRGIIFTVFTNICAAPFLI